MARQSQAEPQLSGPMNYIASVPTPKRSLGIEEGASNRETYIDEEAERNNPGSEEEEINWPVDESSREWEEPQQREEDGNTGDDLGVDETLLITLAHGVAALVEVLASEACDNCGEGQLGLRLVNAVVGVTEDVTGGRCDRGEVGK